MEYFSTTRWDGAVDLSWYNGTDTEFTLTTPAQLAGLAELVNSNTPATGDSSNVTALWVVLAVAGVGIIVLVVLLVTKRKNKKD